MSVLESPPEVPDGVAGGEDLGVGSVQQLTAFVEFAVEEFVDLDVERCGLASDAAGQVVLPVMEL
jgi:hypothetical protein